jgi:hypothetical protein
MKKNPRIASVSADLADQTAAAMEIMQHYCKVHPGSPVAVRGARLFIRTGVWVALLGGSVEEGIVGIGNSVEAALQAFDAQYLATSHRSDPAGGGDLRPRSQLPVVLLFSRKIELDPKTRAELFICWPTVVASLRTISSQPLPHYDAKYTKKDTNHQEEH